MMAQGMATIILYERQITERALRNVREQANRNERIYAISAVAKALRNDYEDNLLRLPSGALLNDFAERVVDQAIAELKRELMARGP